MKKLKCSLTRSAAGWLAALFISTAVGQADPLDHWNPAASGTTNHLNAVIYTNGLFVAVGDAGTILTSPDGVNWATQVSGTTTNLAGAAYGNGKFVAVGAGDTVLVSADATNWTVHANATGTNADWNSVCFGQGEFAMVGIRGVSHQNFVYVSTDGIQWSQSYWSSTPPTYSGDPLPRYSLSGIVCGDGRFAVMGNGTQTSGTSTFQTATVLTSTDATNWYAFTSGLNGGGNISIYSTAITALTFAHGQFVVENQAGSGSGSEYLLTSTDGTNWANVTHFPTATAGVTYALCGGTDNHLNDVLVDAQLGSTFLSGLNVGSPGDIWQAHSVPSNLLYRGVTYGQNPGGTGVFVAVGGSNIVSSIMYSGAFIWTNTAGGNWSNPMNWSPNEVPGQLTNVDSGDDVLITNAGTYTVVLDLGPTPKWWDIHTLTLGAGDGNGVQTLALTNKIFYVNPLTIRAGGVLNANGAGFFAQITAEDGGQVNSIGSSYYTNPLLVGDGGTFHANNDTFHLDFTVAVGGVLDMPPGSFVQINSDGWLTMAGTLNVATANRVYLYGPMTNSGAINLTDGGGLVIYNDGTASKRGGLMNLAAGVVHLQSFANGSDAIQGGGGQDYVINQGSIIKELDPRANAIAVSDFDNRSGTVTNLSGTFSVGSFNDTLAGVYYVTNGSTIQFSGGTSTNYLTAGNPLVMAGAGQYKFTGGYLDYPLDIITNLQLIGGQLALEPGFQGGAITNLTLNGITLTNVNALPVTGTFNVSRSPLYGNYTVAGGAVLDADIVTFYGTLSIADGGLLTMLANSFVQINSPGWLTTAGTVTVPSGGSLYLYGPMTNSGAINVLGLGRLVIYNDGTASKRGGLMNLAAGVVHLQGFANGSDAIQGGGGQDYVINQGSIIKELDPRANAIAVSDFDNRSGTVTNLSGTLSVGSFNDTLAGVYYVTNGSIIQFSGGTSTNYLTPGSPLVMAGGGSYQFTGGYLDYPLDIIPNLQLIGGQLALEPGFQGGAITNLTLNGITLTNVNALPVTGTFNVSRSPLYGNYTVAGGAVLDADIVTFYGTLSIADGGLLTMLANSFVQINSPGWLTTAGTVTVPSGGSLYLYGPMTNSGAINVVGLGRLIIYNDGTASKRGGLVNLAAGVIHIQGFANGSDAIQGGFGQDYFINQGHVIKEIDPRANAISVTDFTNSGAITSQKGLLNLNKVTLDSAGSLGIGINSKTDYGKLSISGNAALAGTFMATLNGNYAPVSGDIFNALSYSSYSGNFSGYNLPAVVTWQPQYTGTQFSLVVGAPQFALSLTGNDLIFNANGGTPGNQGVLLASPNVALPLANWTPVQTNTFDANGHFSITNTMDAATPNEFFILQFP